MMKKKVKVGSALLLALALAFFALGQPESRAAVAVDKEASCSVGFSIGADYEELAKMKIPIQLYRIASIDEAGTYTAEGAFANVDLSAVAHNESNAEVWQKRAEEVNKLVTSEVKPAKTIEAENGSGVAEELSTGLYLVTAEEVKSPNYVYNFTPYLISLPNNYYYTDNDDTWVYDLTGEKAIGLKPEQTERLGSLKITKKLLNQHITLGEKAVFIFQIDITTPKKATETRLAALTFEAYGEQSVLIENIPAGSQAVVTEIYSGAGYEIVGSDLVNAVIEADTSVSVGFQNKHDGKLQGGHGVVNNFRLDENGQYQWQQKYNSAKE